MSPKDSRNSPNHPQKPEWGNENKQRKNPMVFISLITGLIIATAIGASVITAVILKQGNLIGGNNTASPTPTVAETPTASPTPIVAESPTASPAASAVSLLDTECLSSTPGVEKPFVKRPEPQNIAMGGEVLPETAYLSSDGSGSSYSNIYEGKPAGVICALNSKFRQLNLIVGINGKHHDAPNGNNILLEVSLDNKVVATKNLKVAAKQVLTVDVQNARSLGIKAICQNRFTFTCPYVAFVDMSLR